MRLSDEKTAKRRVTLTRCRSGRRCIAQTASNVINGSGRMTDETRAKVESVIKDLDYRVNVAARNLNRDHHRLYHPRRAFADFRHIWPSSPTAPSRPPVSATIPLTSPRMRKAPRKARAIC